MNTATFDFVRSVQPFGRMSKSLARLSRGAARRSFTATATDLDLAYGQTTAASGLRGGTVECLRGCVWLTHDGDCRDVVLRAGQSHMVDRDARLLVHGLAPSAVRLTRSGLCDLP
jgi:hypothetical protein